MNLDGVLMQHYVAVDGELVKIESEALKLSKSLGDLQKIVNNK